MRLHRKTKDRSVLMLTLFVLLAASGCVSKLKPAGATLRILTYSSLGSKGGFIEAVAPQFQSRSGCTLQVETTLGAAQVLSYLDEPKQRDQIDLVMGVDTLLFERAKSAFYLVDPPEFHPSEKVIPLLKDHLPLGFIPVDYGALSFIYRKADVKGEVPTHLADFLKPELKNKWIVQDPRSSSPGMLFFLFADSLMVKISDLRKQWTTLAPSWDASYKMFMARDASFVWSYLTSLAYHASKGELDQYAAVDFKEGLPLQLEGMGVLNHVGNPYASNPCLSKWVAFVLSPEIQNRVVAKQFMMPVVPGVKLPEYFDKVPPLKKIANLEVNLEKVDRLISRFGREVQGDSL